MKLELVDNTVKRKERERQKKLDTDELTANTTELHCRDVSVIETVHPHIQEEQPLKYLPAEVSQSYKPKCE